MWKPHIFVSAAFQIVRMAHAGCIGALVWRRNIERPVRLVSGEWEIPDVAYMERPNIYQLEMQFWQHLQAQAFYQAAGVLEQIIRSSRFQQGSLDRAQGIVFSRMEVVLQSVGSSTKQDLMRDPDFSGLMLSLTKAANYQALLDIVYDVLALLEDKFYTLTDSRNRKMVSIEQYIGTHFREQGIGAAAISQEFKISTSYLSRIFRADMGMSVVDYIHRLRIAEGKRLLCESTLSVGEIAKRSVSPITGVSSGCLSGWRA